VHARFPPTHFSRQTRAVIVLSCVAACSERASVLAATNLVGPLLPGRSCGGNDKESRSDFRENRLQ